MNLLKWKESADEGRAVQPYYITMAVNLVRAAHALGDDFGEG